MGFGSSCLLSTLAGSYSLLSGSGYGSGSFSSLGGAGAGAGGGGGGCTMGSGSGLGYSSFGGGGSGVRRFLVGSGLFFFFVVSTKLTPSLKVHTNEQIPLQQPRFLEQFAFVWHGRPLVLCSSMVTACSACLCWANRCCTNSSKFATVCWGFKGRVGS